MHILILPSWYPRDPGDISGVFFREQAIALRKHGHQVGVIAPSLRSLRQWKTLLTGKRGVQQEIDAGLPTLRSHGMAWFPRLARPNAALFLLHGRRLLERYVAQYGYPDLIHVHSMLNAGVLALHIKQQYRIPYLVTEHSSGYGRGRLRPDQLRIASQIARAAVRRLAVSQPLADCLQSSLGVAVGSWEEVPNSVEKRFLDRPLTLPDSFDRTFRFVSVALLSERKGFHDLLRAFAKVSALDPHVSLTIGGEGVERSRLEALAGQLGVAGQVQFAGALDRDQVVEAMAAADAFVLASHHETFGVVVIEALAMGKPVVATRCGGPEAIVRAQDGLLVPVADIDALAAAMQEIRADARRYRAEVIRAGCAARYSEPVVTARLTGIYEQVLQPRAGQAPTHLQAG